MGVFLSLSLVSKVHPHWATTQQQKRGYEHQHNQKHHVAPSHPSTTLPLHWQCERFSPIIRQFSLSTLTGGRAVFSGSLLVCVPFFADARVFVEEP